MLFTDGHHKLIRTRRSQHENRLHDDLFYDAFGLITKSTSRRLFWGVVLITTSSYDVARLSRLLDGFSGESSL